VLLADALALPLCSEELMSVSAEDRVLWSDELTAPEETSDCNSFCNGDK
jgi:hypothetical protein